MGFGHVCHLFRASLPFSGHQLKPRQLSQQLRKVGRASRKGEGLELPQEPQEHFIQNTLNAAWRLNTAELVLPFTGREPAAPALLTTFHCSCLRAHTAAQANGPTALPRQLQLKFLQHRPQKHWSRNCNRFPRRNGTHPSVSPSCKTGKRVLPYLMRYKQVCTLIQKAPWYSSDPCLKKISKCPIIRWEIQHSILLRAHLEKLVNCFFWFFPRNVTLVYGCHTDLDLSCRKQT